MNDINNINPVFILVMKIINIIEKTPSITRKELVKILNISEDRVKYNLNKLRKNNIIERIGPDKSSYWKIKLKRNTLVFFMYFFYFFFYSFSIFNRFIIYKFKFWNMS